MTKPTIIMSIEPSDTDAVLSALRHDVTWLLDQSNNDPQSFIGREEEIYSILNGVQLVASRFTRVAPIKRPDRQLDATLERVSEALNVLPTGAGA